MRCIIKSDLRGKENCIFANLPFSKALLDVAASASFMRFEREYRVDGVLGQGGFGVVFAAVRNADGVSVAIKRVAKAKVAQWTTQVRKIESQAR